MRRRRDGEKSEEGERCQEGRMLNKRDKVKVRKAEAEKQICAWIHSKMFGTSVHLHDDKHIPSTNHVTAASKGKRYSVEHM